MQVFQQAYNKNKSEVRYTSPPWLVVCVHYHLVFLTYVLFQGMVAGIELEGALTLGTLNMASAR